MTGSYDPQTDMLYWGIGNPKPDFDTSSRKGDNLYSDSVVALRGTTGQLLWHFQFTPGDEHDWDSNQVPIIADRKTDQGIEKRLLWANRNGFYYVLNRETGAFVSGVPYARQTWAEGLDAKGRPIRAAADRRLTQGYPVFPGAKGATNWWPPSFDPQLDLVFIPVLEQGMVFFPTAMTLPTTSGRSFYTAVRAVDASTGKLAWEHRQDTRLVNNETGGLLSTRGGIVFGSDQSRFFALDSRSGRLLWTVETGGEIIAAPVTYAVGGQQFVTIAAGRSLLTFALPEPPAGANAAPSPLTH
jgi:alcohol dehydrogenase (cytochrome c)